MFGDYEDQLREKLEKLLETFTLDDLIEVAGLTEVDVLTKLILDGHIDEQALTPTA